MDILHTRSQIWEQMKALNDTIVARSARNEAHADESAKYDELEKQVATLTAELDRQNKFRSLETEFNKAVDSREVGTVTVDEAKQRSAFVEYCRTGNDASLRSLNTFSSGEGAALVGQQMYATLDASIRGASVVRQLPGIKVISTAKLVTIPVPATGIAAGVVAQGPSGSYTESQITFTSTNLHAFKLGGIVKVSEELLNDADFDVAGYLNTEMGAALAEKEEALFVSGSGTNETRGFLRTSTGITDTTVLSGSVADGLIDAQFVNSHLGANGVYVFGSGLAKAARKVKNTEGDYLWTPSLVDGKPDRFNGKPVFVTDAAPSTLSAGTVAGAYLVPSDIVIGDRTPVTVQRLVERYADEGFVGFKFSKRVDAVLKNVKGMTRLIWG